MGESRDLTAVRVVDPVGTVVVRTTPARAVLSGDEDGPCRLAIAFEDPAAGDRLLAGNTYDVMIEMKGYKGAAAQTVVGRWELGCRGGDRHHPPETLYFRSAGR
jgi:hypothetical protein